MSDPCERCGDDKQEYRCDDCDADICDSCTESWLDDTDGYTVCSACWMKRYKARAAKNRRDKVKAINIEEFDKVQAYIAEVNALDIDALEVEGVTILPQVRQEFSQLGRNNVALIRWLIEGKAQGLNPVVSLWDLGGGDECKSK